ncbi:jg6230 [Pararge aegeria aegeria]|uniref:Jg6230 protein n=1 Tax=Pararge aegeria aegeria TaxID=348720 RepID=A0A8S4R9A2_9NEOP|nr:jg6230 [Pararge aegeria aegeria]
MKASGKHPSILPTFCNLNSETCFNYLLFVITIAGRVQGAHTSAPESSWETFILLFHLVEPSSIVTYQGVKMRLLQGSNEKQKTSQVLTLTKVEQLAASIVSGTALKLISSRYVAADVAPDPSHVEHPHVAGPAETSIVQPFCLTHF